MKLISPKLFAMPGAASGGTVGVVQWQDAPDHDLLLWLDMRSGSAMVQPGRIQAGGSPGPGVRACAPRGTALQPEHGLCFQQRFLPGADCVPAGAT